MKTSNWGSYMGAYRFLGITTLIMECGFGLRVWEFRSSGSGG